MERFYRGVDHGASSRSSVYSNDSYKRHTYSDYADSMTSTTSRPISIAPSYMNHAPQVPARKPVGSKKPLSDLKAAAPPPIELPTARSPPSAAVPPTPTPVVKGLLFLAIAAKPHPSTLSNVEIMLKRGSFLGIVMLGNAECETELKRLKMDIYALLGKLGIEGGAHLELQNEWSAASITEAMSKAVKDTDTITGVLCSPSYDGTKSVDGDILSLDEDELHSPWKYSVGFLHGIARSTLPRMQLKKNTGRANTSLFLVTEPKETTAISHLYETACDNILTQLSGSSGLSGTTIAYAQDVLVPEPEPPRTNGSIDVSAKAGPIDPDLGDFAPGESPTRLWGMWALQDELGAVN